MSFESKAVTYAGIDVGKETLDLALLDPASGEVRHHRFRNSERGRSALLHLLSLPQPAERREAALHVLNSLLHLDTRNWYQLRHLSKGASKWLREHSLPAKL